MTINYTELSVRRVSSLSSQFAGRGDYKAGNARANSSALRKSANWLVVDP